MPSIQLPPAPERLQLAPEHTPGSRAVPAPLPRARRSLFGQVDHDELRRELRAGLAGVAEEARERWGFDFQAEAPLAGARLRWERVCGGSVPAFYREKPAAGLGQPDTPGEGSGQENQELPSNAGGAEAMGVRRPGTARIITDYFPKRKRAVEAKSLAPKLGSVIEQTPRKRLR